TRVAGATVPPRRPRYPPDYGYRGPPPKQRRRFVPWLVALLLVAAAALAGWYVYSQVQENLQESRPVGVPPLVGLTQENALRQLRELGLEGKVVEQASAEQPAGRVFRQTPDEGTRLPKGETVTLYVSTGPPMTNVPGVVGLTYQDAVDELEKQNLESRRVDLFADAPPGEVIAQKPREGATVRQGSTVTLKVSKGQELVSVPDVLRQNEASARAELGANGFDVSVSSAPSDDVEEGLVFDQNPDPGTEANKGSTVEIVISEGPETATVPGVVGQDVDSATSALENAGFDVRVRDEETTDPAQENFVLDQNPAAGVKAEPGSTVTIMIGKFVLPGADDQGGQGNGDGQGNGRGVGRAKGRSKDKVG
ncbi:MAG: PASTA domain-containing protein, partial [Actinomycetota bacterium]|nr:PASTA domain-containing protein [Actinomycetota bacterium]